MITGQEKQCVEGGLQVILDVRIFILRRGEQMLLSFCLSLSVSVICPSNGTSSAETETVFFFLSIFPSCILPLL